jgi:hypothetical protein
MAETGVATKIGILPRTEATQEPSRTFSVRAKITPEVITKFNENNPQPLKNDEYMEKLNAYLIEEQNSSSTNTNTSDKKTTTSIASASNSAAKIEPKPVTPKTSKELRAEEERKWSEEKEKRAQWNDANRLCPKIGKRKS